MHVIWTLNTKGTWEYQLHNRLKNPCCNSGMFALVTCTFTEIHHCSKSFLYLESHNTPILSRTKGQIYSTYTETLLRIKQWHFKQTRHRELFAQGTSLRNLAWIMCKKIKRTYHSHLLNTMKHTHKFWAVFKSSFFQSPCTPTGVNATSCNVNSYSTFFPTNLQVKIYNIRHSPCRLW